MKSLIIAVTTNYIYFGRNKNLDELSLSMAEEFTIIERADGLTNECADSITRTVWHLMRPFNVRNLYDNATSSVFYRCNATEQALLGLLTVGHAQLLFYADNRMNAGQAEVFQVL